MPDIIMKQDDLGFYVVELKAHRSNSRKHALSQLQSGVDFVRSHFEWDYVTPVLAHYRASSIEHQHMPFVFKER